MLHINHACLHLVVKCSIGRAALHEPEKATCTTVPALCHYLFPKSRHELFPDSIAGSDVKFLCQICNAHVLLSLDDIASIWLQGTRDDLQLSGLSSTVHSYQPDFLPFLDVPGDVFQDLLVLERDRDLQDRRILLQAQRLLVCAEHASNAHVLSKGTVW